MIPSTRTPRIPPDGRRLPVRVAPLVLVLPISFVPGAAAAADAPASLEVSGDARTIAPATATVDRSTEPVPEPTEKALRCYRSGLALRGVGLHWGVLVPVVWLATGWSARLRAFASRLAGGRWYPTVALYFLLFLAISFLVELPLAYDLSNQTLGQWLGDAVKGLAVGMMIATPFVMAHEMGHCVLGHVLQSLVVVPLLVLAGLWLLDRSAGAPFRRLVARLGFSAHGDVAALPLISRLFGAFVFPVSPRFLAFSRHLEHEADRFGLELTRSNRAAAEAFVALRQENLGNPRPGWIYQTWRASHPALGDRIDSCNRYRPWQRGEPLVYGDRLGEAR